jgi:hypothetical protein
MPVSVLIVVGWLRLFWVNTVVRETYGRSGLVSPSSIGNQTS